MKVILPVLLCLLGLAFGAFGAFGEQDTEDEIPLSEDQGDEEQDGLQSKYEEETGVDNDNAETSDDTGEVSQDPKPWWGRRRRRRRRCYRYYYRRRGAKVCLKCGQRVRCHPIYRRRRCYRYYYRRRGAKVCLKCGQRVRCHPIRGK